MAEAVKILFVGMLSVFTILSLVTLIGKSLIALTNMVPANEPVAAIPASNDNNAHQEAIKLAIQKLTNGKMKIEKIETL